ncbi:chromate transporter [Paenibacillus athensensis]|nr:chromate transporter [Paenibacillus athensensis]
MQPPHSRRTGAALLLVFAALLAALPAASALSGAAWLAWADGYYRAGALVFGGGHVVLPLLEQLTVPGGWVTHDQFLAGYGAAQAVPGPLFTFAAYLGYATGGWFGAVVALAAVFLPAFLLVAGAMPFWSRLSGRRGARGALAGVNASVVGLLLAALYDPVWVSAVRSPQDAALALTAFALLMYAATPPWAVVAFCALGGAAFSWLS